MRHLSVLTRRCVFVEHQVAFSRQPGGMASVLWWCGSTRGRVAPSLERATQWFSSDTRSALHSPWQGKSVFRECCIVPQSIRLFVFDLIFKRIRLTERHASRRQTRQARPILRAAY